MAKKKSKKAFDVTVTDSALAALCDGHEGMKETDVARLGIAGRRDGAFQYDFEQVDAEEIAEEDILVKFGSLKLYVDKGSAEYLKGVTIDFKDSSDGPSGFDIENPNPLWKDEVSARIQALMDRDINPAIAMHGGAVELLEVKDANAYVRLLGGCQGCGMADVTLKGGIEAVIKEEIPEIEHIIDSTDHADGENPYFSPAKDG